MEIEALKCQKIEIVDQNGKCQILMYAEVDKGIILLMGEKQPTIQISSSRENPAEIHLMDKLGAVRLTMGMFENGDVGINIRDSKGFPKAGILYDSASEKGVIQFDGKFHVI
jgi:hypothetical protein